MTNRHESKPSHVLRQGIGVATAATLAALAVFVSARNHSKDMDSEAAVQHALKPTMARTAGKIVEFAADHPSLTQKKWSKNFVDITIAASMKPEADIRTPDTAFIDLVIRRKAGSTALDGGAAVSLFMSRNGQVRGDAGQTYHQSIDISPQARSAQEHDYVIGNGPSPAHPGVNINTIDAADPAAAANRIAADAPSVLGQIEADLEYAENPDAHRLMP